MGLIVSAFISYRDTLCLLLWPSTMTVGSCSGLTADGAGLNQWTWVGSEWWKSKVPVPRCMHIWSLSVLYLDTNMNISCSNSSDIVCPDSHVCYMSRFPCSLYALIDSHVLYAFLLCSEHRILAENIQTPVGLTEYGGWLFWTEWNQESIVCIRKLPPHDREVFLGNLSQLQGLSIFHKERVEPGLSLLLWMEVMSKIVVSTGMLKSLSW